MLVVAKSPSLLLLSLLRVFQQRMTMNSALVDWKHTTIGTVYS